MNRYEQRSRESYNKKAGDYENTPDGKFTFKFKEALLQSIDVFDGCVLLDVACGNGRLLHELQKRAAIKGLGIDISDNMIEQAKGLNPQMEFLVGSCAPLPFGDTVCDIVTVCASFHHFPDVDAFAREAGRVIKSGGVIYIAEIFLPTLLRGLCNPFLKLSRAGDVKFYAPEAIVKLFEGYGFSKKSIQISKNMQIIGMKRM